MDTNPVTVRVWMEMPDSISGTHPDSPALSGNSPSGDRKMNGGDYLCMPIRSVSRSSKP